MAKKASPKAGKSKAGKSKAGKPAGTRSAPRRKTPAVRASRSRGGAGETAGTAKYEQPGAPWWKPFLPR